MILELDNWYLGYSQILADCRPDQDGTEGSALLLCNPNVDAMAAARILTYLLRNDGVSYHLLPCMGYQQLLRRLEQHYYNNHTNATTTTTATTTVRAVVLLNLGAARNLTRLFDGDNESFFLNPQAVKLYVMDCRRPVHLANVHAGGNVVVFWDSTSSSSSDDQVLPSDGDNLSGAETSSDEEEEEEEEDDDDEGEEEFRDDEEAEVEFGVDVEEEGEATAKRSTSEEHGGDYDAEDEEEPEEGDSSVKRRRIGEKNQDDEAEDEGSTQDDVPTADATSKGEETQVPTLTPRELHQDRRNRLKMYYHHGTYYGSPASFVAHKISTQMRFQDIGDLLWLACVGVTDAYLHSRLDLSGYSVLAMELRNKSNHLFPNDQFDRVSNTVYAEHLLGGEAQDSSNNNNKLTKIGFSGNGRILSESDFRFFLLRHSSLFDAMVYSGFVSTKLQLTTTRGMQKLQELLAKMGYPLEECHQPFAFMKPNLRRNLREKIKDYAEEYGLENFEFTSFFRITGYQSLLSACDTSYAVSALLECTSNTSGNNSSNNREVQDDDAALIESFNIAFDALNSNAAPTVSLNGLSGGGNDLVSLVNGGSLTGSTGLGAGIRLAMSLQKSIMTTASSLMERGAITRLRHFRYAYVTCSSQAHTLGVNAAGPPATRSNEQQEGDKPDHVFCKPLALTRLAHYLMDLHRETGKWTGAKARPLILLAEKPRTNTYLVVGYEYPESEGDFVKNRFGQNFELAAQSMAGVFRFDSFDSNVVEVDAGDAQRFMEQLHYLMDSSL